MKHKQASLRTSLGPKLSSAFGGGSAGANVGLINSLPPPLKKIARGAFADALSTMWIIYVAFAALGLALSFLITRNVLNKHHEETKTGLEEERKKREERRLEREEKRNGGKKVNGVNGNAVEHGEKDTQA